MTNNFPLNRSLDRINWIEQDKTLLLTIESNFEFPYSNKLVNSLLFIFFKSGSILLMLFKSVKRKWLKFWHCRKKCSVVSISLPQEHNGFIESWKLCLNLCSLRWLSPRRSLVKCFKPRGLCTPNINLGFGRIDFKMEFLNMVNGKFLVLIQILFHSCILCGKNEYLKASVLVFNNGIFSRCLVRLSRFTLGMMENK